ncbi:hypothetical protein WME97_07255 [Sorangium sp. So ce367]|uniref:hypothetical protein n=1 Tax=Sorangium sp. So ce367 TaxID=3133305 RepID=UPI003F5DCF38
MIRRLVIACSTSMALLSACLGGCVVVEGEPLDDSLGEEGDLGSARLALTGVTATWTRVGRLDNALKIAAAHNVIFALSTSFKLYRSLSGQNGTWTLEDHPAQARDIAVAGGLLYALNDNKTLWLHRDVPTRNTWIYQDTPFAAKTIGSGGSVAAVNLDDSIWVWSGPPAGSPWINVGELPGVKEVSMPRGRYWLLTDSGEIYSANEGLSDLRQLTPSLPVAAGVPMDISAARADELWVLTTAKELYKVTFTETNCSNFLDDDRDLATDALDDDCR